ncbi:hypothetical protein KHQ84_gp203 [Rhodococcus phage Finch]|uniref:DUF6884 domain-containing protein n=1 Tax=Rhodococcus phage Finch TaxID=2094144 RepID=A0A2P1JXR4_9CAUD|nr:hypothetical protein KHQ84_gp203 [Rhodococcus phage Finch]AVO25126.1 hypothetical protein SEA_FINCH_203 [Rhodococcus phage Finch]
MNAKAQTHTLVIVPCAADKAAEATTARELYTSPNFAHIIAGALAEAEATERDLGTPARVMILSAKHGLLELDQVVEPYDVKMSQKALRIATSEIVTQLLALEPASIVSLLPATYADVLRAAVEEANEVATDTDLMDAYEYSPGIGYMRGTASALVRNAA